MGVDKLLIEVRSLTKRFAGDESPVLNAVSLAVPSGSFVCLMGPNGVGKSVLAACLAGLLPFDSGNVFVGGIEQRSWSRRSAQRVGIDYLPQILPRPENINCIEFLSLRLPSRNGLFWPSELRAKIVKTCAEYRIDLTFDLKSHLSELSSSELKILYIARALAAGSRMLILDEPTATLDADERRQINAALVQIREKGVTLLVISHPIQSICDPTVCGEGNFHIYHFGEKGLIETPSIPQQDFPFHSPSARISPPVDWAADLILDSRLGTTESIVPGKIIAIVGPTNTDFHRFALSFSRARDRSRFIRLRSSRAREPIVSFVPFNGHELHLAHGLDLVENCLVHRWRSGPWVRMRHFISRADAVERLLAVVADSVGLNRREPSRPIEHLSGGNRQRLLLGRVLYDPVDLLLACDVTHGLDPSGVIQVGRLLESRAARGMAAVLFATAEGAEVALANRVLHYVREDGCDTLREGSRG